MLGRVPCKLRSLPPVFGQVLGAENVSKGTFRFRTRYEFCYTSIIKLKFPKTMKNEMTDIQEKTEKTNVSNNGVVIEDSLVEIKMERPKARKVVDAIKNIFIQKIKEEFKDLVRLFERRFEIIETRIKGLGERLDRNEDRIDKRLERHEARTQKQLDESKKSFDDKLSSLKKAFDDRLSSLEKNFDDKLSSLEKNFDDKLSSLKKAFDDRLSSLEKNFDDKLSSLEKNFDDKLSSLEKNFDDKLSSLKKAFDDRLSSLEKNFDDRLSSLEKNFDDRLSSLEKNFDEEKRRNSRRHTQIMWAIGIAVGILSAINFFTR